MRSAFTAAITAGVSYTCADVSASTKGWCSAWPQRVCCAAAATPAEACAAKADAEVEEEEEEKAEEAASGDAERSAEPLREGGEAQRGAGGER